MPALPDPAAAIAALPPLRDVIAAHGLAARKSLGQHFLLDLNLTARIARVAGPLAGRTVIEVGPGPGGLTRALLAVGARRVIAVEKDWRCRDALAPLVAVSEGRLVLVEADALEVNETALIEAAGGAADGAYIVANLPYNIGTALIVKWLRQIAAAPALYAGLTLLLQKEVAERIVAAPRTKAYGRLSVMCQWLCTARIALDIGPRAFTPPPKVTSSVLQLTPRPRPLAPARWEDMESVVRAAFGQRRKMLRSALRAALGADTEAVLAAAEIDGRSRAEELDVAAFAALARAFRGRAGS